MVMDLTTVAAVKALMGGTSNAADAQITALIPAVSEFAETYLNRYTQTALRTQVYEVKPTQPYLWLQGFPIVSVTSIKLSSSRDFSTSDALDVTSYDVLTESGQIYFRPAALSKMAGPCFAQLVYTGGMAVDTTAFLAAFPRIANGAASEVINRLNRAKNPEGNVSFGPTGGVAYQKQLQPLDDFKNALASQRRVL